MYKTEEKYNDNIKIPNRKHDSKITSYNQNKNFPLNQAYETSPAPSFSDIRINYDSAQTIQRMPIIPDELLDNLSLDDIINALPYLLSSVGVGISLISYLIYQCRRKKQNNNYTAVGDNVTPNSNVETIPETSPEITPEAIEHTVEEIKTFTQTQHTEEQNTEKPLSPKPAEEPLATMPAEELPLPAPQPNFTFSAPPSSDEYEPDTPPLNIPEPEEEPNEHEQELEALKVRLKQLSGSIAEYARIGKDKKFAAQMDKKVSALFKKFHKNKYIDYDLAKIEEELHNQQIAEGIISESEEPIEGLVVFDNISPNYSPTPCEPGGLVQNALSKKGYIDDKYSNTLLLYHNLHRSTVKNFVIGIDDFYYLLFTAHHPGGNNDEYEVDEVYLEGIVTSGDKIIFGEEGLYKGKCKKENRL